MEVFFSWFKTLNFLNILIANCCKIYKIVHSLHFVLYIERRKCIQICLYYFILLYEFI